MPEDYLSTHHKDWRDSTGSGAIPLDLTSLHHHWIWRYFARSNEAPQYLARGNLNDLTSVHIIWRNSTRSDDAKNDLTRCQKIICRRTTRSAETLRDLTRFHKILRDLTRSDETPQDLMGGTLKNPTSVYMLWRHSARSDDTQEDLTRC